MGSSYSRSQVMKQNSRTLITAAIHRRGSMSRVQLAQATDISRTHVSDVVDELLAEGTLVETGCVCRRPGRPRVLLRINPDGPGAAGVWLSEDAIRIAVASADGEILSRESIDYEACDGSVETAVAAIADGIRRCTERTGRPVDSLKGVGLVISGHVDPVLRVIVRTKIPEFFVRVPISQLLSDQIGLPVHIATDIRASAIAHNWYREGEERALYVWFMDGIGAAYVTDHQLFGVAHGMAPSIGHMIMAPDGPVCHCGRKACLEAYTSTYAFISYIWPDVDTKVMDVQERRELVRRGMDLVLEGDATAIKALDTTIEYMGLGIANSINLFDPQVVYIGGVLVDHSPKMMMDIVRREAMKNINKSLQGVEIRVLPEIGEFGLCGAIGSVILRPYIVFQEINSRMLQFNSAP